MKNTLAILALTTALAGCAGGRPLTPEEAYYQREHNMRVFQMFREGQMNIERAGAIRSLGCIGRRYCYY